MHIQRTTSDGNEWLAGKKKLTFSPMGADLRQPEGPASASPGSFRGGSLAAGPDIWCVGCVGLFFLGASIPPSIGPTGPGPTTGTNNRCRVRGGSREPCGRSVIEGSRRGRQVPASDAAACVCVPVHVFAHNTTCSTIVVLCGLLSVCSLETLGADATCHSHPHWCNTCIHTGTHLSTAASPLAGLHDRP